MFRVLFLTLILLSSITFAQKQQIELVNEEPKIQDFTELGKANNGEVKAYFENFFKTLKEQPNLQGYIINYGTAKQIAFREKQIRRLINFRDDYVSPRITFVKGGNADKIKTVIYIVPAGTEQPPTH